MTNKIPEGFASLTPSLNINGATKAIELYKKAFGAKEEYSMKTEDGKIMHACLAIGNSKLFVADTMPGQGCSTPSVSSFYIYTESVDDTFKQATGAGLKEKWPVTDMFWGDRTGTVQDPYGNYWTLATHVKDVSPEEMEEGRKNFMKKAA